MPWSAPRAVWLAVFTLFVLPGTDASGVEVRDLPLEELLGSWAERVAQEPDGSAAIEDLRAGLQHGDRAALRRLAEARAGAGDSEGVGLATLLECLTTDLPRSSHASVARRALDASDSVDAVPRDMLRLCSAERVIGLAPGSSIRARVVESLGPLSRPSSVLPPETHWSIRDRLVRGYLLVEAGEFAPAASLLESSSSWPPAFALAAAQTLHTAADGLLGGGDVDPAAAALAVSAATLRPGQAHDPSVRQAFLEALLDLARSGDVASTLESVAELVATARGPGLQADLIAFRTELEEAVGRRTTTVVELRRAVASVGDDRSAGTLRLLLQLSRKELEAGDGVAAAETSARAWGIVKVTGGLPPALVAATAVSMARFLEPAASRAVLEEALGGLPDGARGDSIASARSELSAVYGRQGRWREARDLARAARRSADPSSPFAVRALVNEASALRRLDATDEQVLDLLREAWRRREPLRQAVLTHGAPEDAVVLLASLADEHEALLAALIDRGQLDEALGVLFDVRSAGRRSLRRGGSAPDNDIDAARALEAQLQLRAVLTGVPSDLLASVHRSRLRRESGVERSQAVSAAPSLAELCTLLADDEVAVEFFEIDRLNPQGEGVRHIHAISFAGPDCSPVLHGLGPSTGLEAIEALSERGDDASYDLLSRQVASWLDKATPPLPVSPDGATLFVAPGMSFPPGLLEFGLPVEVPVHYLWTLADLDAPGVAPPDHKRALILADPTFCDTDAGGACPPCELLTLEQLPEAQEEALAVADLLRGLDVEADVYLGADASEAVLRAGLGDATYLHVATHGAFTPSLAGSKGRGRGLEIVLDGDQTPQPVEGPALDDVSLQAVGMGSPLAASGILLRGAGCGPDPEDDGLLSGLELAGLRLPRTSLVVLAACDVGIGVAVDGVGLLGLAQAFRAAGVPMVIASPRPVQSDEAKEFMIELYSALAAGTSTPDAVLGARQALDRRYGRRGSWWWFTIFGARS